MTRLQILIAPCGRNRASLPRLISALVDVKHPKGAVNHRSTDLVIDPPQGLQFGCILGDV
jgi:hypothetical protein